MLNKKGQVLVIFVILLPIILLILGGLVDFGIFTLAKKSVDEVTLEAANYYLDNIDSETKIDDAKALIIKNLEEANIDINETKEKVVIKVEKEYQSVYSVITKQEILKAKYTIIKEEKRIIKG